MKLKFVFIVIMLLLVSSARAFAADSSLSGIISDEKNNPIKGGVLVFMDLSGKTVKAVVADLNGVYSTTIPQNTYTITVSGPTGSTLPSVKLEKQVISGSTTRNFTLSSPGKTASKRPSISKNLAIFLMIIGAIIAVGVPVIIIMFLKNRKALPESSSSH